MDKRGRILFSVLLVLLFIFIFFVNFVWAVDPPDTLQYVHDTFSIDPGLGSVEEYKTNLFTGAAIFSFPINIPKGVNGLTPILDLSYNSHSSKNKLNVLGPGWSFTENYIQRDTNGTIDGSGIFDDEFILRLDGNSYDLIYSADTGRYHTEIETNFYIENVSDAENEKGIYWSVKKRDGTVYRFGFYNESEMIASVKGDYIWRWSLDLINDTHNNTVVYNYLEDPFGNDGGAVYLDSIEYNSDLKRNISFVYEDSDRADKTILFDNGHKVEISRRLEEISILVDDDLVNRYLFDYDSVSTNGSIINISYLKNITIYGEDNSTTLSPVKFGYYAVEAGWIGQNEPWDPISCLVTNDYRDMGVRYVDVNGDGFTDVLHGKDHEGDGCDDNDVFTYLNNGYGWGNTAMTFGKPPTCFSTLDGVDFGTRLADIDGDGFTDVLHGKDHEGDGCDDNDVFTYLNNGTSGWDLKGISWDPPYCFVTHNGTDLGIRVVDVNGDGMADILRGVSSLSGGGICTYANNNVRTWLSNGTGWYEASEEWVSPVCFVGSTGIDLGVRFADANGDGLVDILYGRRDGTHECDNNDKVTYLNTGEGFENQSDEFDPPQCFVAHNGTDGGYRFADVDGDGLSDIIYGFQHGVECDDNAKKTYLSTGKGWTGQSADSWDPPYCLTKLVGEQPLDLGVRIVDVNGESSDVIYGLAEVSGECDDNDKRTHLKKTHAPYLLKDITTSLGGIIKLNYSASMYTQNNKSTFANMSFNLWLVSTVTEDNGLEGDNKVVVNTTYNYSGGSYDYKKREFRGFNTVEEDVKHTDKIIRHYFYQDNAKKGREHRTEYLDRNLNNYSVIKRFWDNSTDNGYYIVNLAGEVEYTYDGVNSNPVVKNTTYSYDNYSNVLEKVSYGDVSVSGDERYERYEYLLNDDEWIIDKVKTYSLYDYDNSTKIRESEFSYDGLSHGTSPTKGDLTNKKDWLDGGTDLETNYAYDDYGNLVKQTDANNNDLNFTFGLRDLTYTYPDQAIDDKGHTVNYDHDLGLGKKLYESDTNEEYTNYSYDVFGRIKNESRPLDSLEYPSKNYTYDFNGVAPEIVKVEVREELDSDNVTEEYYIYDGFGRLIQTRKEADAGLEIVQDLFYDVNGRVENVSNFYFVEYVGNYTEANTSVDVTRRVYDYLDRVVGIVNPDDTEKNITYDHWNTTILDENGNSKKYVYDAYGQIVRVVEDGEYETNYGYDVAGNLLAINDSQGNNFTFVYDSLGRKIGMVDPDLGTWNYSYDAVGNLVWQRDNKGNEISFGYDSINRVVRKNSSDLVVDFTYDLDKNNTLSRVNSSDFIISYGYDDRLRKVSENRTIGNETFVLGFSYDALDRLIGEVLDGNVINYSYNPQGLDWIDGVLDDVEYSAFGKVSKRDYINSLDSSFSYDVENSRLTRIYTGSVQDLNYGYDSVGNVVGINDSVDSIINYMEYDDLDRLIFAERNGSDEYEIDYSYDSIGRIVNVLLDGENLTYVYDGNVLHAPSSVSSGGVLSIENGDLVYSNGTIKIFRFDILSSENVTGVNWTLDTYEENITSEISVNLTSGESIFVYVEANTSYNVSIVSAYNENYTVSGSIPSGDSIVGDYVYDENGNLIYDGEFNYSYNSFNHLEKIEEDGELISEYVYDFDGNRIKKVVGDEVTYYAGNLIRVVNSTGGFDTVYYYHNGVLVGKNKTNESLVSYYHPDHLGSTTLITNSSGGEVEETNYKPYGEPLVDTDERFTFTGQEEDKESSLQYFGVRYYNPGLRLFVEPDSLIPDVYSPQSLNRYMYTYANPYKYIDEEGESPHLVVAAAIFITLRGAIGAYEAVEADIISQGAGGGNIDIGRVSTQAAKGFGKGVLIGGLEVATIGIATGIGLPGIGFPAAYTIGEEIFNPLYDISYTDTDLSQAGESNVNGLGLNPMENRFSAYDSDYSLYGEKIMPDEEIYSQQNQQLSLFTGGGSVRSGRVVGSGTSGGGYNGGGGMCQQGDEGGSWWEQWLPEWPW